MPSRVRATTGIEILATRSKTKNPKMSSLSNQDNLPQLMRLREAVLRVLSESLSATQPKQTFADGIRESQSSFPQLESLYDTFANLVTRNVEHAVDTWIEEQNLNPKLVAVSNYTACLNHARDKDGQDYNQRSFVQPSASFHSAILASKREELERLTSLIQEQETKAANMRVELNRQIEAAQGVQRKIASLAEEMELASNTVANRG